MKILRVKIVVAFSKILGVPIKVRESFWLGDEHSTGDAQNSGQTP